MARADELRAELDLLDLEDRYAAAKESGASKDELRALGLREARQAFREQREGTAPEPGAARPEPVKATARAKGKGEQK
jgi:hypothetical protein